MNVHDAPAPTRRGDAAAAIAGLRALLGDRLSTSAAVREQHGKDETYHRRLPPDAVVFPRIHRGGRRDRRASAPRHGTPVIAFGTGTSLEGHVAALRRRRLHRPRAA